jgi:NAD(P)-dependent dehydrogenase (short-subunit alcohol dehydrogenase family)
MNTDVQPVVVITGAAGALGKAIAGALAERKASLVFVDRDEAGLEELQEALSSDSSTAIVVADVTAEDAGDMSRNAALGAFGRIDALVNNAGTEGPVGPLEDAPMDEILRVYRLNVFSVISFTKAFMGCFRAQGKGRIINMASGAGLAGSANMAVYSSSKHAVVGLTRSVAAEVAGSGVAVNAICPGCVASPMMTRIESHLAFQQGQSSSSFVPAIPAARYADPAEVANLAAYLALDAPAYLTGAALVVDGAMRA